MTIPLSVLPLSMCVSLLSRAWLRRSPFPDVGPKVLVSDWDHSWGAPFLCWRIFFG